MKTLLKIISCMVLKESSWIPDPVSIYMFKVNKNDSYDARRRSGFFIVNFEHISHLVFVFLMLTLNK